MALLDYLKARKMLDRYGIHSIGSAYVKSADEAIEFSKGKPIVLKVLSSKALHKSKAGLVKLNLYTKEQIASAYRDLYSKAQPLKPYDIIAQKMSGSGVEVIIGGRTDSQFGKVILIGLGGIYVEIFRDFALRIAPITRREAGNMLGQLRSGNVITRGGKNTKQIEELLIKVSRLLVENPKVAELDLNPVIITEKGYEVVDIRVLE
jgi:acyl-CoA synthetase (NDP forming)